MRHVKAMVPPASLDETCPGEDEFAAFVYGDLSPRHMGTLEAHVARCPACRRLLSALAQACSGVVPPTADSRFTTRPLEARGASSELPIGGLIGRYRVLDWLGAGGMGVVYAAHDPELHRKVALKVLHQGVAGDGDRQQFRELLQREAQAMARLTHPNVVAVFDVGSVGDRVFIAMELIEGMTLARWLRAKPRAPREILAAFIAAGNGLAAAHAAGLTHRDFKPDNVLVGNDGRVCVTDFGLARVAVAEPPDAEPRADPEASRAASGTSVVGTLAYMAPEQFAGGRADPRADQFSFAVALYEALQGERPFALPQWTSAGWTAGSPLPARPGARRIPRPVYPVLRRALSASPAERFPSMTALLAALAPTARRGRAIAISAVLAVAITIVGAVVHAAQLRRAADQRTEFVSWLRGLLPDLRTQLRSAYMLPLHDIRPAREKVRAAMRDLERQLATPAGQDAIGLGTFVLGEAARALGDHERALALLETAWAAGLRGPDLEAALGGELGASYENRFRDIETSVAATQRDARLRAIEQRYRDPAIVHLRAALAAGKGSPAYLEALIAFHDHRFDDASARARAAFAEAPTFYEAGELEAEAHNAAGRRLLTAGHHDEGVAEFATARQIFERVLEIARSDDDAWLRDGAMIWDQVVALRADEAPAWLRQQATTALHRAQQINPDNGKALLREARIELGRVTWERLEGRDPGADVAKVLGLIERARVRGGDSPEGERYQCDAHGELAAYQGAHGIDPLGEFTAALTSCRAAAQAGPTADASASLAWVYAWRAQYEGDHGVDPTASFALAEHGFRAALALEDDPAVHYGFAQMWTRRAAIQATHDEDPRPAVDAALAEYNAMLRLHVNHGMALAGSGEALAVRARYQLARREDAAATIAQAHAAVDPALAREPTLVMALLAHLAVVALDAELLIQRDADPAPALARMRGDVNTLRDHFEEAGAAQLWSCRAESLAARWALAHGHAGVAAPYLARAAAAAALARTIDAQSASAWIASAEVERLRAQAGGKTAVADGLGFLERAIAIDPRRARARELRDELAGGAARAR